HLLGRRSLAEHGGAGSRPELARFQRGDELELLVADGAEHRAAPQRALRAWHLVAERCQRHRPALCPSTGLMSKAKIPGQDGEDGTSGSSISHSSPSALRSCLTVAPGRLLLMRVRPSPSRSGGAMTGPSCSRHTNSSLSLTSVQFTLTSPVSVDHAPYL